MQEMMQAILARYKTFISAPHLTVSFLLFTALKPVDS